MGIFFKKNNGSPGYEQPEEIETLDRKKEFQTMYQLLQDAEKYDRAEEYGVSYGMLDNLTKYIKEYVSII